MRSLKVCCFAFAPGGFQIPDQSTQSIDATPRSGKDTKSPTHCTSLGGVKASISSFDLNKKQGCHGQHLQSEHCGTPLSSCPFNQLTGGGSQGDPKTGKTSTIIR